jgi:hypothetical protein
MGERIHTEEEWSQILAPFERHLASRHETTTLSTDQLVAHFKLNNRYLELLELHRWDLLGDWADAWIADWLGGQPELPRWFVATNLHLPASSRNPA